MKVVSSCSYSLYLKLIIFKEKSVTFNIIRTKHMFASKEENLLDLNGQTNV